ncbi:hypothetical protein PMIN06_007072 [Paraphaeosphaeria minitans]|uniref:Uncharacterized protein n=1 Tax=Paraphaeosphaeria minitans TaxID=565426 RepID=A0A9P6KN83_9PLEO|nr:hypothetical protein PMIN01_09615 [Paraphaeosphaeria minitans]
MLSTTTREQTEKRVPGREDGLMCFCAGAQANIAIEKADELGCEKGLDAGEMFEESTDLDGPEDNSLCKGSIIEVPSAHREGVLDAARHLLLI